MPIDERRRDAIAAAVAAYNDTHPDAPLRRSAARLLAVMFPTEDVCRQSWETVAAEGFSLRDLSLTLRQLVAVRFLSRERGRPDTYRLHLPPRRRR
jgi:hypothetical protein